MSLSSFLENMRGKPNHVKKHFAFWTSLGVTALIAVFWVNSIPAFGRITNNPAATIASKAATPGQTLVASVGTVWNQVRDMIFGAKKVSYSSVEVLPGKK